VIALEDIWREHKRFVLAVGLGTIGFLGGIWSAWAVDDGAAKIAKRNRSSESEIRALSGDVAGREGYEAGVALALENEIRPATSASVEFQPRPEFALGEKDSPFIKYGQAIDEVKKTRAEALRRNIACPEDFGFVTEPPEDRVRVHIASADLVERVLFQLVLTGVKSIETLRPGEPDYVRAVEEPEAKDGASSAPTAPPAGDAAAEPPMLRRLPVHVAAIGSVDALERFLSAFQVGKSCLELAALRVVRQGEGVVRFEVDLAALTLVSAAEARTVKPAGSGRRGSNESSRLGRRPR
jgi:hypothetical protein